MATSGQAPFAFAYRDDLRTLPASARDAEVDLHGGFAADTRADFGHLYTGMPGRGILRIDPDLRTQELIHLSDRLTPMNFHSTKLGLVDGSWRLILSANSDEMVAVIDLEGNVDFVLPRPEFEAYADPKALYRPTDTELIDDQLYIADGYGSNYITRAHLPSRSWSAIFGGKTDDPHEDGRFATAHGLRRSPTDPERLMIADRPSSRLQAHDLDGSFLASFGLPLGSWPCGIDYIEHEGRWLAVVGSLRDPVEDRPAPIYILDGESHEVLSTIRPKEELGLEAVQHLHNVVWHRQGGELFLVCQAWNPGFYFVLGRA
jgi:hypothetical protein